jgi:hypothetical protein
MNSNESFDRNASHMAGEYVSYNEPVAWRGEDYDGINVDVYFEVERNKLPYRLYETATPLYTHPVKELTDEEIEEIYFKDFNYEDEDIFEFARAVLKKASEK